ncbi:MAG TPA: 2-hydroxyacid dehydrogenase [Nocardioidaceae bacterium]|nr:2-hydroxyacid dehydrogenase [Nocardioidaceae bacterium]
MRVWLPWDRPSDVLGDLPDDVKIDTFRRGLSVPESLGEVEFYVPEYMGADPRVVEVLGQMPSLRVVQAQTAGYENLLPHLPDDATLCNARGVHDASTAELAMTLILASLRRIPPAVQAQDRGEWLTYDTFDDALADRTVLIVGYGSIGEALERRLDGFECEVLRVARRERPGVAPTEQLPELLPRADVVVLMTPATDHTVGMVDATFLAHLKDDALLVNISRGPVVDTDALVAELGSGRIRAALDVTDPEPLPSGHPLWSAPNLLITPHRGGASTAFPPRVARLVRDQLARYVAGEPLHNVVAGPHR